MERFRRAHPGHMPAPGKAFALTETLNQTQRLYAVCPRARQIGLMPGMTLAEARAITPTLISEPADPNADAAALEALARWLVRYTPLTATDATGASSTGGADGLLLDISGCAHLFGGEKAMLADLQNKLAHAGITARLALAPTVGTAWALARFRPGITVTDRVKGGLLDPLPIRALRLDDASAHTLTRLGLKTLGDLTGIERPALARRFKGTPQKQITALLTRLDQLTGRRNETISPFVPLPSWQVRQAFIEPAGELATVTATTEDLLTDLMHALQQADLGVRRLTLSAYRVDGTVAEIQIGTGRPSRDISHLMRLFAEKLPDMDAGFGFDLLLLSAEETESLNPQQIGDRVSPDAPSIAQATAQLIDRLTARLGTSAVTRLKHRHSHIPERQQSYSSDFTADMGWDGADSQTIGDTALAVRPRPLRLLGRPELIEVTAAVPEGPPVSFIWRRVAYNTAKSEGPERIAAEWWLSPESHTRDYYRIEVEDGSRFWLFQYGLYRAPGVRSGEVKTPCWYMHGMFA